MLAQERRCVVEKNLSHSDIGIHSGVHCIAWCGPKYNHFLCFFVAGENDAMAQGDMTALVTTLVALSTRHAKYGVGAEDLGGLFDCLHSVASMVLGHDWTPEVEAAWKGTWMGMKLIMEPTLITADLSDLHLTNIEIEQIETIETSQQELIASTWQIIEKDAQAYGMRLFINMFQLSPSTLELFSFADQKPLEKSPGLSMHVNHFMTKLGFIVGHIDVERTKIPYMQKIAKDHSQLGIDPQHFIFMGKALMSSWEAGLGNMWTAEVRAAWESLWKTVMQCMKPVLKLSREGSKYRKNRRLSATPNDFTGLDGISVDIGRVLSSDGALTISGGFDQKDNKARELAQQHSRQSSQCGSPISQRSPLTQVEGYGEEEVHSPMALLAFKQRSDFSRRPSHEGRGFSRRPSAENRLFTRRPSAEHPRKRLTSFDNSCPGSPFSHTMSAGSSSSPKSAEMCPMKFPEHNGTKSPEASDEGSGSVRWIAKSPESKRSESPRSERFLNKSPESISTGETVAQANGYNAHATPLTSPLHNGDTAQSGASGRKDQTQLTHGSGGRSPYFASAGGLALTPQQTPQPSSAAQQVPTPNHFQSGASRVKDEAEDGAGAGNSVQHGQATTPSAKPQGNGKPQFHFVGTCTLFQVTLRTPHDSSLYFPPFNPLVFFFVHVCVHTLCCIASLSSPSSPFFRPARV